MADTNPQIEIVPDMLLEKRGHGWLFQASPNGALSYLSGDGRIGWRSLAPAAAIEGNLHRGQLAQWRANPDATDLTLTWRYPRLPVTETMTVRLPSDPAAMTIERVLLNTGPVPLPVYELRMLPVDGGGVLFADRSPADLRCLHVADMAQFAANPGHADGPPIMLLPQQGTIFGDAQECPSPAFAIGDAAMQTVLLEASPQQQDVFTQMWQIKAREDWRVQPSVLAGYAAIARHSRRQPLMLAPGQPRQLSLMFYQMKAGCDPRTLFDDCLAQRNRRADPA